MTDTTNLGLPEISGDQASKFVTHNEALTMLDVIVHLTVADRDLTSPPGSPSEGDRYIVGSSATGAWAGWDQGIAVYQSGAWVRYAPKVGWQCFVADEAALLVYVGAPGYWIDAATASAMLGINTTADATNRLALKSDAALFSHDDVTPGTGDMRITLNKSAAAKDLGFVFQDNWSMRALFGLLGDDNFTVKVTPDGSTFNTAFSVDKNTGAASLEKHPKFSGYCNYDQYNAAGAWFTVDINNLRHNDQAAVASGIFTAPHDGYFMFGAGARHKTNGTVPAAILLGLSVNAATPNADATTQAGEGSAAIDDYTSLNLTTCLKLSSGDTVRVQAFFVSNDAYLDADCSYFWGAQIA